MVRFIISILAIYLSIYYLASGINLNAIEVLFLSVVTMVGLFNAIVGLIKMLFEHIKKDDYEF